MTTGDSDIDLIAVYADLDCARRWDPRQESARLGERAVGWPVDVMATDLPRAGGALSAADHLFERHVRDRARLFGLLSR